MKKITLATVIIGLFAISNVAQAASPEEKKRYFPA